jgi:formamidopyrimidine-DNA glycosylase
MPELPEVETITRDLSRQVVGGRIARVYVWDRRVIRNCPTEQFIRTLTGQAIAHVFRRGKAIGVRLESKGFLVIQPMMTGQLLYGTGSWRNVRTQVTRITFELSNNRYLNYNDQRLFGRLTCVEDLNQVAFLKSIGLEPFSRQFTTSWLEERTRKRDLPIKNLLMNQHFLAGIGNIYASEILFCARLHPKRPASSLSSREIKLLHAAVRRVLKEAIRFRGTSMNTYRDLYNQTGNFMKRIQVYGRGDEPCFRCGMRINRIILAGRSTYFCQRCQT